MDKYFLTFDADWCPGWMINELAEELLSKNIKATWFLTNTFNGLDQLLKNDLFEIGIHPNFFPGSSHGNSPHEVLSHLKVIVPFARVSRSHSLLISERHLQIMAEDFGITHDSSIYLNNVEDICAHKLKFSPGGNEIIRIPHIFQDNMHFINNENTFELNNSIFNSKGLKVFNFHPIHLHLNTDSLDCYNKFKSNYSLEQASRENIACVKNLSRGTRTIFDQLTNSLAPEKFFHISEVTV